MSIILDNVEIIVFAFLYGAALIAWVARLFSRRKKMVVPTHRIIRRRNLDGSAEAFEDIELVDLRNYGQCTSPGAAEAIRNEVFGQLIAQFKKLADDATNTANEAGKKMCFTEAGSSMKKAETWRAAAAHIEQQMET
jgi:hypothetical protein